MLFFLLFKKNESTYVLNNMNKMGFDIYVMLNLMVDEKTGMPFVYDGLTKKPYIPEEYQVPEKYRRFLDQRGSWFCNFILTFEGMQVSADRFLDNYPSWEDVMEGEDDMEMWTIQDHEGFQVALEWFASKGCFVVSWSY